MGTHIRRVARLEKFYMPEREREREDFISPFYTCDRGEWESEINTYILCLLACLSCLSVPNPSPTRHQLQAQTSQPCHSLNWLLITDAVNSSRSNPPKRASTHPRAQQRITAVLSLPARWRLEIIRTLESLRGMISFFKSGVSTRTLSFL